jgi:hypothetical protein
MSFTYTESVVLESEECINCGVLFALPGTLKARLKENGGTFYCPNGHSMVYRDPEVVRLRREVEQKSRDLTAAKCEALRERNEKEAITAKFDRQKRRVKNGVCPCCKRTFKQLAQHMAHKHPDFNVAKT